VLLYEETFPYPGPSGAFLVEAAGWADRIPNNPERLFQMSAEDGAVFAFQADTDVPISTAFYSTTELDTGSTGMAFPHINLPGVEGLRMSVDIRPSWDPDNVSARFAVQVNGNDWFCELNPLPVPTTQSSAWSTYTRTFNPAAANWRSFSMNASDVTIGAVASTDLAGAITGAGLVFTHTVDNGTHDFDNFRIIADALRLNITEPSNNLVTLSWMGTPTVGLQHTVDLVSAPLWLDVSNTLGQSSANVSIADGVQFFRLYEHGPAATNLVQNLGFEADVAPVTAPLAWSTSGDDNADSVEYGGYQGSFSLQHSNAAPYQVETSQLVSGLSNGFYKLTAYVKNSGGQSACYLAGNERITSLPPLFTNWTEMIVRGIAVTNGQCLVRVYSDATGSNWCRVDEIHLTRDDIPYVFLKGGDVSELPRLEHYGGRFYDGGVEKDCLQIMRDHGCNIARIRLYNDPGNTNYYPANQLDPLGWQNPARTLALAQRIHASGMQIQLTFHYSDYWSNPGTQYKPHNWEGLSFAALSNAMHSFTRDFMMQMTNQGTPPEFVSLGNEINGGILFPDGANSSSAGWDRLANLLNGGYAAVKSVSPATQVILHISNVDAGTVNWFFGNLESRGVNYDVVGCSYYPFWHDLTTEQARAAIDSWYANYGKPVMIMETGYRWNETTCNGSLGQLSDNGPEFFPSTPQGHKSFMLKLFNDLKLVADGHCIGDLYWDPVFICVPGQGWQNGAPNVVANTTLFDFDGNALPSLDAYEYNN